MFKCPHLNPALPLLQPVVHLLPIPPPLPPGCFFTLSGDTASAAAALRPLSALRVLSLTNWHSLERGSRVEGGALRQCGATALVYLNLRASRWGAGTCVQGSGSQGCGDNRAETTEVPVAGALLTGR